MGGKRGGSLTSLTSANLFYHDLGSASGVVNVNYHR